MSNPELFDEDEPILEPTLEEILEERSEQMSADARLSASERARLLNQILGYPDPLDIMYRSGWPETGRRDFRDEF